MVRFHPDPIATRSGLKSLFVRLFKHTNTVLLLLLIILITKDNFNIGIGITRSSHDATAVSHSLADVSRTFSPQVNRQEIPSGRMIVMTMNRAASLKRLLTSLQDADYGDDRVDLDIWIDRMDSTAPHNANISRVARECSWKQGAKTIYTRRQPGGLYQQWMYTWDLDSPGDIAVILEDDLELSPAFYQWLKMARSKYGDDPEVGGFTLQRTVERPRRPPPFVEKGAPLLPRRSDIHMFKYRLQGSWGFAPKRETWREFLAWYEAKRRANEKPYVERHTFMKWYKNQERGRAIAKDMWTLWYIKFVDERNIFTVTPWAPYGTTLSGCWRAPGLHFGKHKYKKPDFPIFRGTVDDFEWPDTLLKLDWDGTIIDGNGTKG